MEQWISGMGECTMEATRRFNINRGYMKLEVWRDSIQLLKLAHRIVHEGKTVDLRLKSQILSSAQSVSANVAEGYCRKSINEYLQYLHIALGSLGEVLTRMIGLLQSNLISADSFESFDVIHYSVENKLLALIRALQLKRKRGGWEDDLSQTAKHA